MSFVVLVLVILVVCLSMLMLMFVVMHVAYIKSGVSSVAVKHGRGPPSCTARRPVEVEPSHMLTVCRHALFARKVHDQAAVRGWKLVLKKLARKKK